MAETNRQFSLRHVKHETKLNNTLYSMLMEKNLVDVILCSDSTNISAHRLILSANSSYFKALFDSLESNRCQIPIIVLKDVPLSDVKAILEFMYKGEVSVDERQLHSVLKSAELLKVFGLTEVCHALRSRLNNESNAETTPVSNSSPQKRPRISDGVQQTAQQPMDFFSGLINTRFEFRASHSTPISSSIQSNQQQLQTVRANASNSPTIVKNVILPSEQIHRKTDSNVQNISKETNSVTTNESIRVISSPAKTTPLKSYSRQSGATNQSSTAQKSGTNQVLPSTWTPSHQTSSLLSSSSGNQSKTPIEVLIDEETNEDVDDIKPPIFELNQSLNLNADKEVVVLDIANDSDKNVSQNVMSKKPKPKTVEKLKLDMKSGLKSIKSRTSSTSSQSSLPPPPSYLVVQRSSSRLLRNIIKPTTVGTTSLVSKSKDNSEDKNKSSAKKDRQSLRLIRQKGTKSEIEPNSGCEESPEVECPSCGLKFNDEETWNEHIARAHPPVLT